MTDRTILIIGASRGIGRHAVDHAIERGCSVRAMARSADDIGLEHERLEKFAGDATDSADVRDALDDVDAVILALGLSPGLAKRRSKVTLFSRATEILVGEMASRGPRRLVVVTGYGAGESRKSMSRIEGLGHRLLLGGAYDDKDIQERIVENSSLDWTIVRPTILTNGPATGRFEVLETADAWRNGLISRRDVAEFLIACALDGVYLHQAPVLAY
ncbi:MAG: SDR family NAD(P)-dependent oxidoreductase [Gammaproteobacteria bacterium]|jgi:putative NADH-flavin reductase|nr:SDR family NAD(P)-dependent oxidoreductase [Gammaproteobacteria bacterium]